MTKKNYIAIAKIINEVNKRCEWTAEAESVLHAIRSNLSQYFQEDNPAFDRNRFLEACTK
jgi:hypothetical protein